MEADRVVAELPQHRRERLRLLRRGRVRVAADVDAVEAHGDAGTLLELEVRALRDDAPVLARRGVRPAQRGEVEGAARLHVDRGGKGDPVLPRRHRHGPLLAERERARAVHGHRKRVRAVLPLRPEVELQRVLDESPVTLLPHPRAHGLGEDEPHAHIPLRRLHRKVPHVLVEDIAERRPRREGDHARVRFADGLRVLRQTEIHAHGGTRRRVRRTAGDGPRRRHAAVRRRRERRRARQALPVPVRIGNKEVGVRPLRGLREAVFDGEARRPAVRLQARLEEKPGLWQLQRAAKAAQRLFGVNWRGRNGLYGSRRRDARYRQRKNDKREHVFHACKHTYVLHACEYTTGQPSPPCDFASKRSDVKSFMPKNMW